MQATKAQGLKTSPVRGQPEVIRAKSGLAKA